MSGFRASPPLPEHVQVGFGVPRKSRSKKKREARGVSLSPSRKEASPSLAPSSTSTASAEGEDQFDCSCDSPVTTSRKTDSTHTSGRSLSDDEDLDEDRTMPQNNTTTTLNSLANPTSPPFSSPDSQRFRRMFITSDYSAKRNGGVGKAPPPKPKISRCPHGLVFGVCTENSCCTIISAAITRTDQRQKGQLSGRKLVEYHVSVEFHHCNASIWHRYSGFRSFYEMFVGKYGRER